MPQKQKSFLNTDTPEPPVAPLHEADLPYPVTFFLTGTQRRRVLASLRRRDSNRVRALLKALRLDKEASL